MPEDFRCGYVTLIGRPNVGKSTLLNQILGQKISITSRKPQTTRWQTLGIKTRGNMQCIYVDTPGLQTKHKGVINRHMNREAVASLAHVNVIVFILEALIWTEQDKKILETISRSGVPIVLVVNKIDKLENREDVLPYLDEVSQRHNFAEIIPVSGKNRINTTRLEEILDSFMPVSPQEYPEDQLSDRNERFFAAEFIREKLTRKLGEELPYKIAITIDRFALERGQLQVHAVIWVEGEGQKKIVIGKNGEVLKKVGELARKDMEQMFGYPVYLQSWVKVKKNWTDDVRALKQFGYSE